MGGGGGGGGGGAGIALSHSTFTFPAATVLMHLDTWDCMHCQQGL